MKKIKYLEILFLSAIFSLLLVSCASGPKKAVLTECPERFFWKIEGTDTKGENSTLYIQGTIHIGKDELFPLPEAVETAFDKADRYVAELSTKDFDEIQKETMTLMINSYSEDRDIRTALSYQAMENLKKLLPEDMIAGIANFDPWVLTQLIMQTIYNGAEISADAGLDMYFMKRINEKGKRMEGLDTLETQMALLTFGDYDSQLKGLEDLLSDYPFDNTKKDLLCLYNAYKNNDKETVYAMTLEESVEADSEFMEGLMLKRNQAWVSKFDEYLKRGGTTFIFAGSAHFLGLDSVFECMRKEGILK